VERGAIAHPFSVESGLAGRRWDRHHLRDARWASTSDVIRRRRRQGRRRRHHRGGVKRVATALASLKRGHCAPAHRTCTPPTGAAARCSWAWSRAFRWWDALENLHRLDAAGAEGAWSRETPVRPWTSSRSSDPRPRRWRQECRAVVRAAGGAGRRSLRVRGARRAAIQPGRARRALGTWPARARHGGAEPGASPRCAAPRAISGAVSSSAMARTASRFV
jgi:hypothetical protein